MKRPYGFNLSNFQFTVPQSVRWFIIHLHLSLYTRPRMHAVKSARVTGRKSRKPLKQISSPSWSTSPLPMVRPTVLPRNAPALNNLKFHVSMTLILSTNRPGCLYLTATSLFIIRLYPNLDMRMSLLDLVVTRLTGNRFIHFQVGVEMLLPLWCEIYNRKPPGPLST